MILQTPVGRACYLHLFHEVHVNASSANIFKKVADGSNCVAAPDTLTYRIVFAMRNAAHQTAARG
jgi:hypothetical protein